MSILKKVIKEYLNEKELVTYLTDELAEINESCDAEVEAWEDRCTQLEDILAGLIDGIIESKSIKDARSYAITASEEMVDLDREEDE